MYVQDTIAAISTPVGEGGIGIVRVSGANSREIAARIFVREKSGGLQSHRFYYGNIRDPDRGSLIDEVMVVFMAAPKSYTCENVLEIQCHGGYLVVRKILEIVLRQGARLAEPGEFTKRAFLNGRIDLVQAEAVIDVIRGKTDAAVALAQHQREGLLSNEINLAKKGLIHALAMIEAYLDFPEEDIEPDESTKIKESVADSKEKVANLLMGFDEGRVLRDGVSVLIAGKPNVGKSSLLNAMLREKRAIVTSVPGTTRDIIEEIVNVRGLPVRVLDTAGIRITDDLVEQEGVNLALGKIEQADLVLFVLDGSRSFEMEDNYIIKAIEQKNVIVVKNKSDLPCKIELPLELNHKPNVEISTLSGDGIDMLQQMIFDTFMHNKAVDSRDYVVLSSTRHRDALRKASDHMTSFLEHYQDGMNQEILALDLRYALNAMGEVTGETTPDDILDYIFQRFCIGK